MMQLLIMSMQNGFTDYLLLFFVLMIMQKYFFMFQIRNKMNEYLEILLIDTELAEVDQNIPIYANQSINYH